PLIAGVAEMIEDLRLRPPGEPQARCKRSTILDETFLDLAWARSGRVVQAIDMRIVTPEIRRKQKQVDAQVQLVRELPDGHFGDVGVGDIAVGRHAAASSNRIAEPEFAISGVISRHHDSYVAEFAMRIAARC